MLFFLPQAFDIFFDEGGYKKYFLFVETPSSSISIIKDYEESIVNLLKYSMRNKQLVFGFSLKDFDFSI